MILYLLKKANDSKLWECYKLGYAADGTGAILSAGDVFHRGKKIKNRGTLRDDDWRAITLAYLEASVAIHSGGPWPQYGFPDRSVIPYPQAIGLVRDRTDLGREIIRRNRENVVQLIDDISEELREPCEEAAS